MDNKIYSVAEITREIKSLLESSFPRLWIEGELSNFKRHSSGHIYFTLKDENSQISCAMWRFRTGTLNFEPQSGMRVRVEGDVQVYERGGNYQLIVQQMQPAGIGALQQAFEALKRKLHEEGLFEQHHKKPLPKYPEKIAVVTSPTGAAIRDIINVLKRRFPRIDIFLYPVSVQGSVAAEQIAAAIDDINRYADIDVMIIGRGGGSLEDLWAFNEEVVARAIFASAIPIISAVGHEIDFSIADFVADHRAPTPSAAAEIAVPNRSEVLGELNYYHEKYQQTLLNKIRYYREKLQHIQSGYGFRRPEDLVYQYSQRLDELQRAMQLALRNALNIKRNQLDHIRQQLAAMNPASILDRGYSICYKDGEIVKDARQLTPGDSVTVALSKGRFKSDITDIE